MNGGKVLRALFDLTFISKTTTVYFSHKKVCLPNDVKII